MEKFAFNSFSTQYDPQNGLLLAEAARLAYATDEAAIKQRLAQWGLPESHYINQKETQGFIATNDEVIIVAFRGTEADNLKDWMTDLKTRLKPGPAGQVHRGFQQALNDAWDELWGQVQIYQGHNQNDSVVTGKGKSLWFTGHSLGAALATLAVAKLRLEMDQGVFGLYTFGSPRVGDRVFAEVFNANFGKYTFRFVNNNDLFTRIPLRKMNYSHVGTMIYIDNRGDLQSDIGWWWRFLDRLQAGIEDYLDEDRVPDGYLDHGIWDYVGALEKHPTWRP